MLLGITVMLNKIWQFLKYFRGNLEQRVEDFGASYSAFGVFGILNYPTFYLIWIFYNSNSYENLPLRLIATFLCLCLLLKDYWPNVLKPWLPVYWYFTLLVCLPYFFFFMLFKNNGASVWLMSSSTILFWLPLMVDWWSFIILFILGVLLAIIMYFITTPDVTINFQIGWGVGAQFVASFIVVAFFAHKKQLFDKKKLEGMSAVAASVAHELRTPLFSISAAAENIKNNYSILVETYQLAQKEKLSIKQIDPLHYEAIPSACNDIEAEARGSFTIIEMLLANFYRPPGSSLASMPAEICSIRQCVEQALHRYPFDQEEQKRVNWSNIQDFNIRANKLRIIHILFNLLKNALYQIKATRKGEITIWTERGTKHNLLYFKDTAKGISSDALPYIFDQFFTNTYHGTGIGLTFCKMVMKGIGGDISCESKEGEYAMFILYFPQDSSLTLLD